MPESARFPRTVDRSCGLLFGDRVKRGLSRFAQLFRLRLDRLKLVLRIFGLKGENLLNVLGVEQLLRQIEGGVNVCLREGHGLGHRFLGAGRKRFGRAGGFLGRANETQESLARLLEILLGKLADLRGDLLRNFDHRCSPAVERFVEPVQGRRKAFGM
ncbi:protein of unknown function [Methylocella tundrae]|uniref:Uncharacterized protein n=1 Tax=Methylocella tundrae TaxID=227605 RepID=A0A4U8Z2E1_METTU|nr:protein of unknown function [Methylocella tundrae]